MKKKRKKPAYGWFLSGRKSHQYVGRKVGDYANRAPSAPVNVTERYSSRELKDTK